MVTLLPKELYPLHPRGPIAPTCELSGLFVKQTEALYENHRSVACDLCPLPFHPMTNIKAQNRIHNRKLIAAYRPDSYAQ